MLILSLALLMCSYAATGIDSFMGDGSINPFDVRILNLYLSRQHLVSCEVVDGLNVLKIKCTSQFPYLISDIAILTKLNVFYCTHSRLSVLPPEFAELQELVRLYFSSNNFKTIPRVIFSLSKLKHLDFSQNDLTNISENILNLENLEYLNLEFNQLKTIPNMSSLTKLKYLNLSKNLLYDSISCYDKEINTTEIISEIKNLEILQIDRNFLEQVYSNFWLSKLKILSLEANFLIELPLSLNKCTKLEELYLRGNCFITFPRVILSITSLKVLNLDCFQITETLELNDYYLPNLKTASLSFKNIDCATPVCFRLSNVEKFELTIDITFILNLSEINLPNCIEFLLKGNITELTGNFSNFRSLESLKMKLSNPYVLRDTLYGFKNLRRLSIQFDNYKRRDIIMSRFKRWDELRQLESFSITDAALTIFPYPVLSCINLTLLDVSNNKITMIPDEIHKLQKLVLLNVENNNISTINTHIFKIKTLKKAMFNGNVIEYLPKEFINVDHDFLTFDRSSLNIVSNKDDLGFFDLPEKYLENVDPMDLYYIDSLSALRIYKFIETGDIKWNLSKVLSIKPEEIKKLKKGFAYLTEIWVKYVLPNTGKDDLSDILEYIKTIYSIPDSTAVVMNLDFLEGKEIIKDYIENIFEILKHRVIKGETDFVKIIFALIRGGIHKCFNGQLEAWRVAFISLNNDYNEDLTIESFIKNTLANVKENTLKKITISNYNPQNVHIFSYWKEILKDELGFSSSTQIYENSPHLRIYESKGYILYKFFKGFKCKNVIEEIVEIINQDKTMLSAIIKKFFKDNELNLSRIQPFFEYDGDIEDQIVQKITFNGVLCILRSFGLVIH